MEDTPTHPPGGWDAVDPRTGAPLGIDEGWNYAPGARADDELRSFVQDKLIEYPPAISRALSVDVNRYVNAEQSAPDFVREVLADGQRNDPLWLGFVERPDWIDKVSGANTRGSSVLLRADRPRHDRNSHEFDGKGRRPAVPEDYAQLEAVLNDPDDLKPGTKSDRGNPTVVALKAINGETFRVVWEVLSGKRNRSLQLVSLVIKTAK